MKGSVEERQPMADEGRPDWIVEQRSDRLVRSVAFEQEDDLSLGQEDGVSSKAVAGSSAPSAECSARSLSARW
jgi:hypothetical protein